MTIVFVLVHVHTLDYNVLGCTLYIYNRSAIICTDKLGTTIWIDVIVNY